MAPEPLSFEYVGRVQVYEDASRVALYECPVCAALVAQGSLDRHAEYHASSEARAETGGRPGA